MPYYKCPNCKGVFKVEIFVDPAPLGPSDYPPMPCPNCGRLSPSVPLAVYILGKKIKTNNYSI
jgi:hypothetical protein